MRPEDDPLFRAMLADDIISMPERHALSEDTWGPEERAAVLAVLDSGRYTMGAKTAEYEAAYAAYCGTQYCVACNSGSSANLLMVAAYTLRWGPGTVIVPAVGWATSYAPWQQYGWHLVFVDVDPDTLDYDLPRLWDAAERYEDAVIMAINLLGNPCQYWSYPRKCHILEDNCESMGAMYQGRRTGSFGLMASHSTYFSHHICTGEGGMVTTSDEEMYHLLLALRSHGWTRHLPENNAFKERPEAFRFVVPGYNLRPTDIQSAIGIEQLKKLPGYLAQRRVNASTFPLRTQVEPEGGKSSWYGFVVHGKDREIVSKRCETRPVVTGNFLRQPVIDHYDYTVFGPTRGADYLTDECLMIGNSHLPTDWGRILWTR